MITPENIYQTRAAQRDPLYRDWITSVNYVMLMNTGAPIHGNAALNFTRMRRWYLAGVDTYTAAKRLNTTAGPPRDGRTGGE